jgi:hypothetical protein
MEARPELLIGLMVVLVLLAISLTVWLLRYVIRGQRQRRKGAAPVTRDVTAPTSAAVAGAASPPAVERPAPPTAPGLDAAPPPEGGFAEADQRTSPSPAPAAGETGDVLLMQVWQDRDGFLLVEVDGQRYRRLFDIRDGVLGRRVLEVINRLVAFSKGQESRSAPPPSSAPGRPAPAPGAPPVTSGAKSEEQAQAVLEQLQQVEAPLKKSRFTVDPRPFRRRSDTQELTITLNLAEEIDQLVQIRAKASPEFSQRHIRVASAPDGGLRFEVDGQRYGALAEIPDPQVQALIRAAISDWEARR